MGRPKSSITKVTTSVTLPRELILKLKHLAVDNNTSMSQVIEQIATKHFKDESLKNETKEERANRLKYEEAQRIGKKRVMSVTKGDPELIKGLCGISDDVTDNEIKEEFHN